jgi:hypothetical protein
MDTHGYVDFDRVGDVGRRRYMSGLMFQLFGGVVSWMNKRQVVVALFTIEVEYMVANHACKKAIWIMKPCSKVGLSERTITIQFDSNNVICLAKKSTFYAKTKHIDIQYHLFRDMVEDGNVTLEKVDTLYNVADAC